MTKAMEVPSSVLGATYGRLHVVHVSNTKKIACVCVCGNKTTASYYELRTGRKKSCGCLKRSVLGDAARKHGMANSSVSGYKSRAYGIWQAMRDRCSNPNRSDYKYYGGRGVKVCARWKDFEAFLADMGEPPKELTLDRINNAGNYEPSNCRWATRAEQTYNSRGVIFIEHKGARHNVTTWIQKAKISTATYYNRRKRGMTELQALGLE